MSTMALFCSHRRVVNQMSNSDNLLERVGCGSLLFLVWQYLFGDGCGCLLSAIAAAIIATIMVFVWWLQ